MLRKTVLSLKSPTGAFIAPLRCANANLFNKVQEKLAKNKKAPARHKAEESYLLTTKLYCGKCGALMFGESGVSHTGKMYTYYKCAAAKKKKTCDKKAVRKQWLEDLVVNQTMQLVKDDAAMESIIAKVMELQNKEDTNIPLYEKQLRNAESGIQNMLNAIQAGILTSSTKERLEALEDQRKELQARIAEERLAKPKMKEEFVRFWLLRFRKLDMTQPEQRQALVDTFINAIYLYDDKVLITFNYKEGTETVAFGEAVKAEKSSDMSARGAPNFERQILRFVVLSLCRKAAAHFLHTVCTFARIKGVSAQGLHSLLSFAYGRRTAERRTVMAAGIDCIVVPRKEADGKAISATTVRQCLQSGDWDTLETLLPQTSLAYFRSPEAAPVLERIRKAGNVVHYENRCASAPEKQKTLQKRFRFCIIK